MKGELALFHDLGTNYLSNLTAGTFRAPSSEQSRAEQSRYCSKTTGSAIQMTGDVLFPGRVALITTPMCVRARTPAAPCEGQAADKLFSLKFEHQQELRWQHLGGRRVRSEEGEEGEESPLGQRVTVGGELLLTPAQGLIAWFTSNWWNNHWKITKLFFFCFRTK